MWGRVESEETRRRVQEFRSSRVQESRSSEVLEFKSSRVEETPKKITQRPAFAKAAAGKR
jgi:hypothetical protein